jgi:2',3'-cyclic-nucleotide 2'-phosphodiesterase (5'-nucleotidase family)
MRTFFGPKNRNQCRALIILGCAMLGSLPVVASELQTGPSQKEINLAQSLADSFQAASGAEVALVAVGQLNNVSSAKELREGLLFTDEPLWVVSLSGRQLKEAFEKSAAFYPSSMTCFLHVSGAEISFSVQRASFDRVQTVSINGRALEMDRQYKVAMTSTLAHGALGFSPIWEFKSPEKEVSASLEKLLQGKTVQTSGFRWSSNSLL